MKAVDQKPQSGSSDHHDQQLSDNHSSESINSARPKLLARISKKTATLVGVPTGFLILFLAILLTPHTIELYQLRNYTSQELEAYHLWKDDEPSIHYEDIQIEPLSQDFVDQYNVLMAHYTLVYGRPWHRLTRNFETKFSTREHLPSEPITVQRHPYNRLMEAYENLIHHPEYSLENFQHAEAVGNRVGYYRGQLNPLILNNVYYDLTHDNTDQAMKDLELLVRTWEPGQYAGGSSYESYRTIDSIVTMVYHLQQYEPDVLARNHDVLLEKLKDISRRYAPFDSGYSYSETYMVFILRYMVRNNRLERELPKDLETMDAIQLTALIAKKPTDNIKPWDRAGLFPAVRNIYSNQQSWQNELEEPMNMLDGLIEELERE